MWEHTSGGVSGCIYIEGFIIYTALLQGGEDQGGGVWPNGFVGGGTASGARNKSPEGSNSTSGRGFGRTLYRNITRGGGLLALR